MEICDAVRLLAKLHLFSELPKKCQFVGLHNLTSCGPQQVLLLENWGKVSISQDF